GRARFGVQGPEEHRAECLHRLIQLRDEVRLHAEMPRLLEEAGGEVGGEDEHVRLAVWKEVVPHGLFPWLVRRRRAGVWRVVAPGIGPVGMRWDVAVLLRIGGIGARLDVKGPSRAAASCRER